MKKHTLYYIVLSALAMLAGCSEEDGFGLKPIDGNRSLTATIERNDASRTAVSEEGQVAWTDADAIGVFGASTSNAKFTYQSTTGDGSTATFRGDFPEEEILEKAYYPYQEDATLSGNTLTLNLPSEYTYTGNSDAPMLGIKNTDGTFAFKHLTGLLRITINNVPEEAERFVITSSAATDAPSIAGQATVADISAENAILSVTANGSKEITYRLGTLTEGTGFRTFFVPLPVGEYPQLSVALYAKDAAEPYFTKTLSSVTVRRAVMIDMPILDAQTGAQYVLSENTTEITEDMAEHINVSPDDNTTLIYGNGIAEEDVPQVGDILLAKMSDNFPDGFLGKVSSITENGDGSYTVATGIASLSEAFDELYVNETATLEPEEETRSRAEGKSMAFNIELTKEIETTYKTEGAPFYAKGGAEFGSQFATYISIDKENKVDRVNLTFVNSFTMKGEIGLSGTFPSAEEAGEARVPLAEIKFKSIPVAYGVIQIKPVVVPALVANAKGTAENKIGFETKIMHISGAEYVNGKWNTGSNRKSNGGDNKSPWKFEGGFNSSLTFKGKLFAGFAFDLDARLYNREDMKIGIGTQAGINLEGELEVNDENSESLEQILSGAKLTTSVGINASFKADASLLVPGDLEAECELFELKLWEREIPLLPFMQKPTANVRTTQDPATAEQAYHTDVATEVQGPTLLEGVEIAYALENEETGEVEAISEPTAYSGDLEGEIYEGEMPQDAVESVEANFDHIKKNTTYRIYPVVTSTAFTGVVKGNQVSLSEKDVSISTEATFEEKLHMMYESTGGDDWTNNEYWDENGRVILGKYSDGTGTYGLEFSNSIARKYGFNLSNNKLNGTISFKDCPELISLNVSDNHITSLTFENCPNLGSVICNNSQLQQMKFIDCPNIERIECEGNPLNGNLQFVNCFKSGKNYGGYIILNKTQATTLDFSQCAQWEDDVVIEVTGSPQLQNVQINVDTPFSLDCSNCPQLDENLSVSMPGVTELTLDNCTQLTQVEITDCQRLREIHANSCANLTKLTIARCAQLERIYSTHNPALASVSISNTPKLARLNSEGSDNLTTLECNNATGRIGGHDIFATLTALTHLTLHDDAKGIGSYDDIAFKNTLKELRVTASSSFSYSGSYDLSGFSALTKLYISEGYITSLEGCTALETIDIPARNGINESYADYLNVLKPCTALKNVSISGGYGEIPQWLSQYENIRFDNMRYVYYYNYPYGPDNPGEYGTDWEYIDRGGGWYYPGEPTKGYSGW